LKKLRERVIVFLSIMILWLLIDEYIKEGYFFKIEDMVNGNITHEKIIVGLLIVLILTIFKSLRRS